MGAAPHCKWEGKKEVGMSRAKPKEVFFAAGDGFVLHHLHVEEEERASPASRSPSVKEG